MSKLGELLKSEREKKGLSLHEIGMSLKINSKVLKAIEEGDEANFPAKTFLRGFIKSYAQYLRLDANQILQMFQEEFGSTRPEEPKKSDVVSDISSTPPKYESSLRRNEDSALPAIASNKIYTIVGAIVLLVGIAFVAKMMDKYQKESRISKSEVIAAVEGESSVIKPADLISPNLVSGTETTTTTSMTLPAGSTTTLAAIVPVTTSTTTNTTTTTARTTTTSTTLRPTTTSSTTSTTVSVSSSVRAKNTEVIVEALSKVSVKFSLNDGRTDTIELSPDQVHTFRSRGTVQLEISDGGAVNIIVNGRDRGVPGTIGKSIKLSYP